MRASTPANSRVPSRRYGQAETAFIAANWQTMTDAEMADAMDRTLHSVETQRIKMGHLRKLPGANQPWAMVQQARAIPKPKGMRREQIAWASENPTDPEAVLILGMAGEGILRVTP